MSTVTLPPAPTNQALIFQRLRGRLLANTLATIRQGPPVRLLTIALCSLLIWGCVYAVGLYGFGFLKSPRNLPNYALAELIVGITFDLLFLALALMLIFSGSIILYSSLFSSAEVTFLLSTPAATDQVFAYKYQGAIAFSSWAFILLGSPMLIAYGVVFGVPWYFYAVLPLFFLGFVLLPGSVGALISLLVVNYIPKRRKQVLVICLVAVVMMGAWWVYHVIQSTPSENWTRDAAHQLLSQFSFAQHPLMPSHWMSQGLMAAGTGRVAESAYRLALVWSNGLFLYIVTAWLAARLYRRGYNRMASGGTIRRRYGTLWLDRAVTSMVGFLDPQVRYLLIKDFRTFRRDPAQWAQVLIFTGLMLLYFANIRRFYEGDIGAHFKNVVSLINLAAIALLLCTYTGRFIFPMLSLEGRKFWILGLLPLRRERLLWGKFAFSATWAILVAEVLVIFSDLMLGVSAGIIMIHVVTIIVLAFGLSGLSVGLGATMPNFRESDPSKIAVGFGGTLNLVAGLLFLLLTIGLMAVSWHLRAMVRPLGVPFYGTWWLYVGMAGGLLLGIAAVLVPLRLGARSLQRMEF